MNSPPRQAPGGNAALRIAAIYLVVGVAWILLSDAWMLATGAESFGGFLASSSKGILFVASSALLIFVLLKRHIARLDRANVLAWSVITGTNDAVFVKDLDRRYRMLNSATADVFGRSVADALGKSDDELVGPDAAAQIKVIDDRVLATGRRESFEETLERHGKLRTFLTTKFPYRNSTGEIMGLVGVARDVTDRKQSLKLLTMQEERLRMALAGAEGGVWDWNLDADDAWWSPEMYELWGVAPGTAMTFDNSLAIVHPDDRALLHAAVNEGIASNTVYRCEFRINHPTRGVLWMMSVGSPQMDEAGRCVRLLGVTLDVTARKLVEEKQRNLELQMLRSQKLESLGLLAGGIAHDFNNLLNAIVGNAVAAQMQLADDSLPADYLQNIIDASRRSAAMTKKLLAYAGGGVAEIRTLRLDLLVDDLSALLKSVTPKSTQLRFELQPAVVEGDADQLQQVVMNLLINASEALQGSPGTVSICTAVETLTAAPSTEYAAPPLTNEVPAAPGDYACLTVQDDGCGMTDDVRSRIFDPFFTTKTSGHGLGLAAVAGIVGSHRGFLKTRSQPGAGTTIKAYLPASTRQVVPSSDPLIPKAREAPPGRGEVLVVARDPAVRGYVRRALGQGGFTVHAVETLDEAVVKIVEPEGRSLRLAVIDALDLDFVDQARRRLHEGAPDLPRLILGSYQDADQLETAFGSRGTIMKPFTPRDLVAKVQELLEPASIHAV